MWHTRGDEKSESRVSLKNLGANEMIIVSSKRIICIIPSSWDALRQGLLCFHPYGWYSLDHTATAAI